MPIFSPASHLWSQELLNRLPFPSLQAPLVEAIFLRHERQLAILFHPLRPCDLNWEGPSQAHMLSIPSQAAGVVWINYRIGKGWACW